MDDKEKEKFGVVIDKNNQSEVEKPQVDNESSGTPDSNAKTEDQKQNLTSEQPKVDNETQKDAEVETQSTNLSSPEKNSPESNDEVAQDININENIEKNGEYFFYFPAKDSLGIFRIGAAKGKNPTGPFIAEKEPIVGSYSIDPSVFKDNDGKYYMYFGGIWGGQLQRWRTGEYNPNQPESPTAFLPNDNEPALLPLVARMSEDMLEFDEKPKEVKIVDENGDLILSGDNLSLIHISEPTRPY